MKIVKIGTNTKNADGIKLNRETKTAFEKYLKAKQKLDESNFKDITVEILYASWLATFKDSEDYKKTMEAKEAKANEATNNRNQNRENRKNAIKAQYIEAGMSEEDAERYAAIAVNTKKKTTKKTTKQKEKN